MESLLSLRAGIGTMNRRDWAQALARTFGKAANLAREPPAPIGRFMELSKQKLVL